MSAGATQWSTEELILRLGNPQHCCALETYPKNGPAKHRKFGCIDSKELIGFTAWIAELSRQVLGTEPRIRNVYVEFVGEGILTPCVMQMIYLLLWLELESSLYQQVAHRQKIDASNTKRRIDSACAEILSAKNNCDAENNLPVLPDLELLYQARTILIEHIGPQLVPLRAIEDSIARNLQVTRKTIEENTRVAVRQLLALILQVVQWDEKMRWEKLEAIMQFARKIFWELHPKANKSKSGLSA